MTAVIDFLEFKRVTTAPTLVLVGLHRFAGEREDNCDTYDRILSNCRMLLDHVRACNIPVAHARSIRPKGVSDRLRYPPWIAGFEPLRSDMIFDLLQPSCYSNAEFSQTMSYSNGNFAIAGMFGETTCLSTAIDAHHRRHNFTYLSDATVCRSSVNNPAHLVHGAVSRIMSAYGVVMDGAEWRRQLPLSRDAG